MGSALLSFEHSPLDARPARSLRFRGAQFTIHTDSTDSAGQFALVEVKGEPGVEPPLHVHRNEDELFYVLEGSLKIFRGLEEIILQPGQSGLLPRNVPHTFKIMSGRARFLIYLTPAGFEGYFRDMARCLENPELALTDMAGRTRIAGRYGVKFLG